MQKSLRRACLLGILGVLAWVVTVAGAQTAPPPATAKGKLERLRVAAAPVGWDTNLTWLHPRSGSLDKRPVLEFLVGIDRRTGAYIPELAEQWEMAPDGKSWTITLRKGVMFHDHWGEFTAKDVQHSLFLLTQPEAVQTDTGLWRTLFGIAKADSIDVVAQKVAQMVQIVHDHQVIIHTTLTTPELVDNLSANTDLMIQSKAYWDAGGKELYGKKMVGTGPFEFVERKVGVHILYKGVANHWRQTPEYKELEFRWVPEGVTRLATLLTGEVHVADVERALQKDAVAKGMQIVPSTLSANQVVWYFGGLYFASPDKLNPTVPFVDKRVRQAMNMALNRQAIAENLLLGRAQPARVATYHPELDSTLWPGIWNPAWDQRFEAMYGYNPSRAKALLEEAGYPQGFEFTVYLFPLAGLPEQVDIGQAMALDWQAVGLKPKLVEVDFPRVREQYRTKAIHGAVWGLRGRALAADSIRIINRSQDGVIYAYEHPFIEERLQALGSLLEPGARTRLLREIGDHKFQEFAEMPLFWLFAEAAVNPKVVAEYVFPGSIPGFYTHLEYIKLAP
jgi:ABC-type transport system substrate-binding protein